MIYRRKEDGMVFAKNEFEKIELYYDDEKHEFKSMNDMFRWIKESNNIDIGKIEVHIVGNNGMVVGFNISKVFFLYKDDVEEYSAKNAYNMEWR